jgi:hypothetical protein
MADSNAAVNDADKLYAILNGENVHPVVLDSAINSFSEMAKNQVVARVASTFAPPPGGALLDRLLFISTPGNQAEMAGAFIVNLRSPLPEARRASLQGLEKLEHPALVQFALLSVRDESDMVVALACQILTARTKQDPVVWKLLRSAYTARVGRQEFYLSNTILEAHGVTALTSSTK